VTRERHLAKVISEKEFIPKLKKKARRLFFLGTLLIEKKQLSQEYYSNLESEAHSLETFLDNYKARGNRTFVFFTELVASLRWIAKAVHTLKHILNRYTSYGLKENEKFFNEVEQTIQLCHGALLELYKNLREEAHSLDVSFPLYSLKKEDFIKKEAEEYLVQDIDEVYCINKGENITEITFRYVDAAEKLCELLRKKESPTEDEIEELMSAFHRIQSKYDSYIKGGEEEKKDKRLSLLRGYISISLHLLEAALYLSHFYERHANGERLIGPQKRVSEIVDPRNIKEKVNILLSYARDYALEGDKLARKFLKSYADMTLTREIITIPKGSILHLRPASALVEPVIRCNSPVLLEIDGKRVRANSVLEIIAVMGEVADKIKENDVEMVLQGDREVVKKMKENFLSKILETKV